MAGEAHVFNIAAGDGFSDRLVEGLLLRYGGDPLTMNRVTLLLPTRRGMRAVRDAFLRQTGGRAMLLPRMQAIGDVDEEELLFDPAFDALHGGELLELPPAITGLRRRLGHGEKGDPVTTGPAGGARRATKNAGRFDGIDKGAVKAGIARHHRLPARVVSFGECR